MNNAKMERIARKAKGRRLVNSGALLQIDLDAETIKTVAFSASSHERPRYDYSGEAPRVYGDKPVTLALWKRWVQSVVKAQKEHEERQRAVKAHDERLSRIWDECEEKANDAIEAERLFHQRI